MKHRSSADRDEDSRTDDSSAQSTSESVTERARSVAGSAVAALHRSVGNQTVQSLRQNGDDAAKATDATSDRPNRRPTAIADQIVSRVRARGEATSATGGVTVWRSPDDDDRSGSEGGQGGGGSHWTNQPRDEEGKWLPSEGGGTSGSAREDLPPPQEVFSENGESLSERFTQEYGRAVTQRIRDALNDYDSGNVAYAEVHVAGQAYTIMAVSGKGGPGATTSAPAEEDRQFETKRTGPIQRKWDTEAKMLERIAQRHGQNAEGTVYLFSEKSPCESCQKVIDQFEGDFKNITVEVTHDE